MGYSRRIDSRIQNDDKFKSMSWDEKNVWFHCFSHPQLTTFGAMRCSIPGLAAEFKQSEKTFQKWLNENLKRGLIVYDREMLMWFPNYLKHNPPASVNVVKSWPKKLDTLPDCPTKIFIIDGLVAFIEASTYQEVECLQQLLDLKEGLKQGLTEDLREDLLSNIYYKESYSSLNTTKVNNTTKGSGNGHKSKRSDIDFFQPSEKHIQTAKDLGLNLQIELRKFQNNARNRSKPYLDLDSGFDNWLLRANEFRAQGKTTSNDIRKTPNFVK